MDSQPPGPRRPRPPGYDEILVAEPPGRCLCNSLAHRRLGCLADVVITFGELGTAWAKDALWQLLWHRSFPLCGTCWDNIRRVAQERRPSLKITGTTLPPAERGRQNVSDTLAPEERGRQIVSDTLAPEERGRQIVSDGCDTHQQRA